MAHDRYGRRRVRLTHAQVELIWIRLRAGELQHDIAADLGLNQGRISEINTGKRYSEITRNLH